MVTRVRVSEKPWSAGWGLNRFGQVSGGRDRSQVRSDLGQKGGSNDLAGQEGRE